MEKLHCVGCGAVIEAKNREALMDKADANGWAAVGSGDERVILCKMCCEFLNVK